MSSCFSSEVAEITGMHYHILLWEIKIIKYQPLIYIISKNFILIKERVKDVFILRPEVRFHWKLKLCMYIWVFIHIWTHIHTYKQVYTKTEHTHTHTHRDRETERQSSQMLFHCSLTRIISSKKHAVTLDFVSLYLTSCFFWFLLRFIKLLVLSNWIRRYHGIIFLLRLVLGLYNFLHLSVWSWLLSANLIACYLD